MTDTKIEDTKARIRQLRAQAERETAWLEKNRLLYTEKRARLDRLVEERGPSGGEVTPEERKSLVNMLLSSNLGAQACGTWLTRSIRKNRISRL